MPNLYRANDCGWTAWSDCTQAMAMRVLRENPRSATNDAGETDRMTGAFAATRTLENNMHYSADKPATIGPVDDIRRVMANRHVHAQGLLAGTAGAIRRPAPRLGQGSRDVLAERGPAALEAGVVRAAA